MKKELLKTGRLLAALMVSAALVFTACENNDPEPTGPEGPEGPGQEQGGGNEGQALPAPAFDPETDIVRGAGDAKAQLSISWGYVENASGYKVTATRVSLLSETGLDETPKVEVDGKETDRTSLSFEIEYGGTYSIEIIALGGNGYADSEAATAEYFWYVEPVTVEAGDLAAIIGAAIEAETNPASELTFALVATRAYTLDSPLDFGQHKINIYSMGEVKEGAYAKNGDRAIVTIGENGQFYTAAGITFDGVNFDCTAQSPKKPEAGFITMTPQRYSDLILTALAGSNNKSFYLDASNPIVVKNCNFKNMPGGFLSIGINSWSIDNITIDNCIMQFQSKVSIEFLCFNPGNSYGFLYGEGGDPAQTWRGEAREVEITNTTIYNTGDAKARIYNGFNPDLKNHFLKEEGFFKMTNVTLHSYAESYDNSFNNTGKVEGYKVNLNNNIFYNLININKFKNGNADYSGTKPETNVIYHQWRVDNGQSAWSLNGMGEPNESEALFASCVEVKFTGTAPTELDLTDNAKGGQNFKYSTGTGDPRWN